MSHQSGSSDFWVLFKSALQDYQKQTGITLAEHPMAQRFQNCDSVESITALLQGQTQALGELKGSDRMTKSLNSVVSVMCSLSAFTAFGSATDLVRRKVLIGFSVSLMLALQPLPPVIAIYTGLAILLVVCSYISPHVNILVILKYIRSLKASILPTTHS
jgi:hypothetical protein